MNNQNKYRYNRISKLIKKYYNNNPTILSIGWLESHNPYLSGELFGVDNFCLPSKLIRENPVPSWNLFYSNGCNMSEIPSNVFDVVDAEEVIEHINNPVGFFFETNRVLKNGGILVISTPNVNCIFYNWRFVINDFHPNWHINVWNVKHLVNFAFHFGFKCELIEGNDYRMFGNILLFSRNVIVVLKKISDYKSDEWIDNLMHKEDTHGLHK